MKNKKRNIIIISGVLSAAIMGGCASDFDPVNPGEKDLPADATILRAQVKIEGMTEAQAKTRMSINQDDQWTWGGKDNYFTDGDTVGVFSRTGNMNLPTSDGKGGPLFNIPMYFVAQKYETSNGGTDTQYTLENDTVYVTPPSMAGAAIMMYYPYTPTMGQLANYPNWEQYPTTTANANIFWGDRYPDLPGIELRVKVEDGSIRCRDILQMRAADTKFLPKGLLRGTFDHSFASIVIMRGAGFKNPKRKLDDGTMVEDESITVVLDTPITHVRPVSYTDHVRWTTQLYYMDGYEFDGKPMSQDEAKLWPAWRGNDYPTPNNDPNVVPEPAWYVVIPTVYHQNDVGATNANYSQRTVRPTVVEIQLYDDEGFLQHVTNFNLNTAVDAASAAATKKPAPDYRWPITIEMDELGPTARPVSIGDWERDGDDKDLTEKRSAGIHSVSDYNDWVGYYNTYISQERAEAYAEPLKTYGDLVDGKVWYFYISEFPVTSNTTLNQVKDLQDRLIGDNNFFNVTFEDLNLEYPLFEKVSRNGGLTNIDFRNLYINANITNPIGILAGSIDSEYGTDNAVVFQNCHVYNGTLMSKGPVGMLAGTVTNGRIIDCLFSGFIMGTSTAVGEYKNLFGSVPENLPQVSGTIYSDIIFSRTQ